MGRGRLRGVDPEETRAKQRRAYELRSQGLTWKDVAIACCYETEQGARTACRAHEKRLREAAYEQSQQQPSPPKMQETSQPEISPQAEMTPKEKHWRALALRKRGYSYGQIANLLGYAAPASAYDAVQSALKQVPKQTLDEAKAIDLERLDEIWRLAYNKARAGDQRAVKNCIDIIDRRARIYGFDIVTQRGAGTHNTLVMNLQSLTTDELRAIVEGFNDRTKEITVDGGEQPALPS